MYTALLKAIQNPSKLIADLAAMLDNALFAATDKMESREAKERQDLFDDFCALCVREGVPLPEVEVETTRAQCPKIDAKDIERHEKLAGNFSRETRERLRGNSSVKARGLRAIADALGLLPAMSGEYSGMNTRQIVSLVNAELIELGVEPVRPNYEEREVRACGESAASKELRVLIVDDGATEIFRTMRALAGWENIRVVALLQECEHSWNPKPEEIERELNRMAKLVLEAAPHIVLMDEGLRMIEGHNLIGRIRELAVDSPVFVANTGGSEDSLRRAGALPNCNKGESLRGVAQAVQYCR